MVYAVQAAKDVVLAKKPVIDDGSHNLDPSLLQVGPAYPPQVPFPSWQMCAVQILECLSPFYLPLSLSLPACLLLCDFPGWIRFRSSLAAWQLCPLSTTSPRRALHPVHTWLSHAATTWKRTNLEMKTPVSMAHCPVPHLPRQMLCVGFVLD